ncbi:MAG: pyridoxamine 5'-phosphate oxidase family protein [Bacteroidota bacterium]
MLIEKDYDLNQVLLVVQHEIHRAAVDRKHPFRYVVLGTNNGTIAMRYIVLRKVTKDFKFILYSDYRSGKVEQLQHTPGCQLLFYHSLKRAQVIVSGVMTCHHTDGLAEKHWQYVQGEARKAYCSLQAPGTPIDRPEKAYAWDSQMTSENFAVLHFEPTRIEVLQLRGLEHLRAIFEKANGWEGTWIVP